MRNGAGISRAVFVIRSSPSARLNAPIDDSGPPDAFPVSWPPTSNEMRDQCQQIAENRSD